MKKKVFFYSIAFVINLLADDTQTYHRYIWANYNHFAGKSPNIKKAQEWYKEVFSSKSSIYSYKGYLHFLVDAKQWQQIIKLMPSLQEKFAQDPDIQLIFVQALEKTKQYTAADNLVVQLSQTFKTHPDISLQAAQTYLRNKDPENGLLTIKSFLNNTPTKPNNFIFYFLQSHIHVQLNQLPQALESVKQCLDLHPQFDKGWLLYASLHEKEGQLKEALSGYTTFLELSGGNDQIEQHLFNLMLKHKNTHPTQPNLILRNINVKNALSFFQQGRYPQALAHINRCIEQEPTNTECIILKIQILASMKNFDAAAATISTQIIQQPLDNTWPKALCLLSYNGMPATDVIKTLESVIIQQPDNFWAHAYCADMCLRNAHQNKALTYLEKAAALSSNSLLTSKILYQVALVYYEQNNYDQMLNYLEQAYTHNKECPHTNNSLAYYWATKGKNLDKANSFIEKSLQYNAANPYFLDTKALILYKEKKYTQSQDVLEKLVNHNNNGTMLLHLAKVHYALNNKENADIFTKKAEQFVKNDHEKKAFAKMQLLLAQT